VYKGIVPGSKIQKQKRNEGALEKKRNERTLVTKKKRIERALETCHSV